MLNQIDFNKTLLHGMLGFLLFAGALHVNINDLRQQYRIILGLATAGTVISTFLVGVAGWWMFSLLRLNVPFIYCLLFGALISPTDPIAVLGLLKRADTPKSLEIKIVGESLFNDGVGVVIFLILLDMAGSGHEIGFVDVFTLFVREALGGGLLGLGTGLLAYWMLNRWIITRLKY